MKCQNCGKKVARFPLKKQPDKTFKQNFEEGTINWWNLFKIDLMSIIWIIVIIVLVITYKADIKTCEEITTNPLRYCEESNACKIIEERKILSPFGIVNIEDNGYNSSKEFLEIIE